MRFLACALALVVAGPLAAQETGPTPPPVADAPPPVSSTVETGADASSRMTVPVMINGAGPFHFVIDTGADRSVVSRDIATQLGLAKTGSKRLHAMGGSGRVDMVRVDKLQLSHTVSRHLEVAVLPRAYVGADGLLGLDSLKGQRIVMDFKANVMTIEPSGKKNEVNEGPASGGDLIVVTARTRLGQLVLVDADANGQKVWVVVDTGAQNSIGNTRLRKLMAQRSSAASVKPVELIDVLGQRTIADYMIVNRLRIGGILLGNAAVAFADAHPFKLFALHKKPSMLLGVESLRGFERVSVDFATRKISFLLPAGTAKGAAKGADPMARKSADAAMPAAP